VSAQTVEPQLLCVVYRSSLRSDRQAIHCQSTAGPAAPALPPTGADYDLIALEDLSLAFMNHNRHLSLSSHDAGWGGLRQCLGYKAEEAGIPVIAVDPSYTSQKCSGCGRLVKKTLAVRVHRCPFCRLVLDRDVNAARNILQLAVDTLATPTARTGQAKHNVTHRGVRALRSGPL
jgi:IS605 OrfB family transposase